MRGGETDTVSSIDGSAMLRRLVRDCMIAVATLTVAAAAEAVSTEVCGGDCDESGHVTVSETIVCIRIGLGEEEVDRCSPCDMSRNATVEIHELLRAVANSLSDCSINTAPSVTPSPSPSPLTQRRLTIADSTGELGAGPDQTRSGLFSTSAAGGNIATRIEGDDLVLILEPQPFEVARMSLELRSDVVLAVETSTVTHCIRLLADTPDSGGFVDCGGGRRFDVVLEARGGAKERPAEPEPTPVPDVRPGSVFLSVRQQRATLPAGATLSECRAAEYEPPVRSLYVSANATASKGEVEIGPITGETFDCDNLLETDGFGMLVGPLVDFDPQLGDVASVLRLADSGESRPTPTLSFPTPTPTATPDERPICGNGSVDPNFGEECDPAATANPACSAQQSCVCCTCLNDEEVLGERTFTVHRPKSTYLSSALAGADVSNGPWLEGPLVLTAGRPDDTLYEDHCSAALRLRDDAVLGFNDVIQSVVCIKLFAAGSGGFVDCDGGRPSGIDVSIDSHGAGEAGELVFAPDSEITGPPGAAQLRIARAVTIVVPPDLPNVRTAAEVCPTLNYEDPFDPSQIRLLNIDPANISVLPMVLTTGRTTGRIDNAIQGGPSVFLAASGESFQCPTFSITDGPGTLVGMSPKPDDPLAGGDVMNALKLAD